MVANFYIEKFEDVALTRLNRLNGTRLNRFSGSSHVQRTLLLFGTKELFCFIDPVHHIKRNGQQASSSWMCYSLGGLMVALTTGSIKSQCILTTIYIVTLITIPGRTIL